MEKEKTESKIEEMDPEFLQELNTLTNQLKTDEEIKNELKSKQTSNNLKEKEKINSENIDKNLNINPFQEALNMMNSYNKNLFTIDNNDSMIESLNELNSTMNKFNSLLNNTINMNNNIEGNNLDNNKIDEKQNDILKEILDFLIQSNLLKDTVLNMKKEIDKSLEKNKNILKPEENKKYEEALLNANNILIEINKINPDKNKILDSLQQLQKISNDIDCILKI